MIELHGQTVLITGAAHPLGIGFATAKVFAAAGASVLITDIDAVEESLLCRQQELAQMFGHKSGGNGKVVECHASVMDICQAEQIKTLIDRHGCPDIVFNNAGSPAGVGEFLSITPQQWQQSYSVNVQGCVNVCQAVLPGMVAKGRGNIVNNASLAGLGAVANMSAYTASKFAVVGLTKSLAIEFGPLGIRVNAVCPGMVWTQMGRQEAELMRSEGENLEQAKAKLASADELPLARWAEPEEIAKAVAYLASDASSYINGIALPVAGGMAPGL